MGPSREQLKEALIGMSPAQIAELTQEAFEDQLREKERREAGRSDDPLGTIRHQDDECGQDILWVRSSGKLWEPYIHDNHGVGAEDHELPWRDLPVVGTMPEAWVAREQEYEADLRHA